MNYDKPKGDLLTQELGQIMELVIPIHDATPEETVPVLQANIKVLESGVTIALNTLNGVLREPYPGACKEVLQQCLTTIELLRKAGLVP